MRVGTISPGGEFALWPDASCLSCTAQLPELHLLRCSLRFNPPGESSILFPHRLPRCKDTRSLRFTRVVKLTNGTYRTEEQGPSLSRVTKSTFETNAGGKDGEKIAEKLPGNFCSTRRLLRQVAIGRQSYRDILLDIAKRIIEAVRLASSNCVSIVLWKFRLSSASVITEFFL